MSDWLGEEFRYCDAAVAAEALMPFLIEAVTWLVEAGESPLQAGMHVKSTVKAGLETEQSMDLAMRARFNPAVMDDLRNAGMHNTVIAANWDTDESSVRRARKKLGL